MNTTQLSCALLTAEMSVKCELALITLGLTEYSEAIIDFEYDQDGYAYASIEMQAETPLQLSIVENINKIKALTHKFKSGYMHGLDHQECLDCKHCQDSSIDMCPVHDY